MQVVLDSDSFASVLCIDAMHDLEPLDRPSSFRGSKKTVLVLPFGEYVKFLQGLPTDFDYLTVAPQMALSNPVHYYYCDIMAAVGKELHICQKWGFQPTHIRHSFDQVNAKNPGLSSTGFARYYMRGKDFAIDKCTDIDELMYMYRLAWSFENTKTADIRWNVSDGGSV